MDRLLSYASSWEELKEIVGWILIGIKNLQSWVSERKSLEESLRQGGTNKGKISGEERMKELKLKARSQSKEKLKHEVLPVDTMELAERAVIRYVQQQHFSREIIALQKDQVVSKSSKLCKLNPVMSGGLLRIGGRLGKAELLYDVKHPVVLPKESPVSNLILQQIHKDVGHMGRNLMLATLRQRYWIRQANAAARQIISKCVICRHYRAKTGEQMMADLPRERLTADEPPFTNTGVDYFGPIFVKRCRPIIKRYGVLFTCLNIRAIHIEVAQSLDTDSCINAVRKFIARRGGAKVLRSDNGTNFIGAERELRQAINDWNHTKIEQAVRQKNIIWQFNPPSASHFGGVWERQIRTIRKILFSLLKEQTIHLDDEALHMLFCEIEDIVNSRPITKVSVDPNDLLALTPNHLLKLQTDQRMSPGVFNETDNYGQRRWKQVQYLANIFWRRWTREYLPMLQERQKWMKPQRNLKIGDIVLIVDGKQPRNSWPLAKVIEIMRDYKGLVRVVKVKTRFNTFVRPVDKLCMILEADDS
ncbi:uncharacterized protein LOC102806053 [Saccoglossus kowalevskii]|uniref:Uncharacterized protein LOC102806053 n=1 Tax=Saccoglossus kowalevskii TaxID=10224 RepID=A0ABM0MF16_SACKO|nr:PREDICTED: uncharacterized protein LOC102806053 [Saccoglossus kowalevskii]